MAQTSAAHMAYLREWADRLRIPILSVDYTVSPPAKPGEGLAECSYAYAWALANAKHFGADPTRIVLSGDSAGGL